MKKSLLTLFNFMNLGMSVEKSDFETAAFTLELLEIGKKETNKALLRKAPIVIVWIAVLVAGLTVEGIPSLIRLIAALFSIWGLIVCVSFLIELLNLVVIKRIKYDLEKEHPMLF